MRHVQIFLIFLDIVVIYNSRLNVSVSIVAMTNAETTNPDFPEFNWSESEKSYIISSFYWGSVVTQFPAGYVLRRFGAKALLFLSTFITGTSCLLIPLSVNWGGWQAYCGIRIVQGLSQGFLSCAIYEHLAKWSPAPERNRLGAFSLTGAEGGMVLSVFLTGMVAASSIGWPGISYISAGLCFFWCLLWLVFAANNAPSSKFITLAEIEYIESSLKHDEGFHKKKIPIPYRAICTSVPLFALLIVRVMYTLGISTFQAQIPAYFNGVLNMNIKSNALYSALPFCASWIMCYIFILIADLLIRKSTMSITVMRKVFNTVAMWIPAALIIALCFLGSNQQAWAIALMTLSVGLSCGAYIGCILATIDLSPNHVGIISAAHYAISYMVPLISPLVVGVIVQDQQNPDQWQIVFIMLASCLFVGNLVYIIWGSSEVQPWDAEDFLTAKDAEQVESTNTTSTEMTKTMESKTAVS